MKDPRATACDVIIIGAGAAGLFCAAACGRRGRSVLVLDHRERTASKVRISGGGRCNFTNLNVSSDHYHSANPHFCRSALARFTPQDMLALCRRHGVSYAEKEEGQIFCATTAREIVDMLERECHAAGVRVRLGAAIRSVQRADGRFLIDRGGGVLSSASLVVATGGLSYEKLGASPVGMDLARQFGLAVVEPRPALVPFLFARAERARWAQLAGVSLPCSVQCGRKELRGDLLFTHKGLSGPVMLQASLYWQPGTTLHIDLLPGTDVLAVLKARRHSKVELKNLLAEHLPKRFGHAWCDHASPSRPLNQISDRDLRAVAAALHAWKVIPAGTEGYGTAEVTAGGVDTSELSSKTMESKKVPGLYFAGEVVDVTGELGGYNLHWAWASGRAAGEHA
jgi:predicted Rossmann fold flavoprotein